MTTDTTTLPGIKERDLTALGACAVCGKPLFEGGLPLFYVIEISRAGIDTSAVQRRIGLGMMVGGNDAIARAFSPDEDLAKILSGPKRVMVHEGCAGEVGHLLQLMGDEG